MDMAECETIRCPVLGLSAGLSCHQAANGGKLGAAVPRLAAAVSFTLPPLLLGSIQEERLRAHRSVRGGEGSLAGGGSFVTARSLAGEGEGGPERDMVGVGLNMPDSDGSGRDACSHAKDFEKPSFGRMSARRARSLQAPPNEM